MEMIRNYYGTMEAPCEACQGLARKHPAFFAEPADGQPYVVYHCQHCHTHHWRYPTRDDLGIYRGTGCSSKSSYPTKEAAEQALATLNQSKYLCWCGVAAPVSGLDLEVYQCPTLRKDWHLAPKVGRPRPPSIWDEEALEIVRSHWAFDPPWAIAQRVNQVLRSRDDGRTYHAHRATRTAFAGGGVIYQAWNLGLIPTREARDQMIAQAQRKAGPLLRRQCQHGRKFKECLPCYYSTDET